MTLSNHKYKDNDIAHIKDELKYNDIYKFSVDNPDVFWSEIAERVSWYRKWDKVSSIDYEKANIKWFEGAKLNISYNCLDRHIQNGDGNKIALIWEGNDPNQDKSYTYSELLEHVCRFANALKSLGVKKGDRVCVYMQMIPELTIAMLACARIGAVHSIVFGAFSSDALRDRINDSKCKILITQDSGVRGNKNDIPMKKNADNAVKDCPSISNIIVVERTSEAINMQQGRDVWWEELIKNSSQSCIPEIVDAEDPLFILYTSGSTESPKGYCILQEDIWYMLPILIK